MSTVFEDVFAALNQARVRYVVVGGVAVVLHGHARLTADLDLIVDLAPDQARAAVEALTGLGFRPRMPVEAASFADPDVRRSWIRDRHLRVFSLHHPDRPVAEVDLFAEHPLPFEELWDRSVVLDLGGTDVRVASVADLIRLKRDAGRPQDVTDIEALERIQEHRDDD